MRYIILIFSALDWNRKSFSYLRFLPRINRPVSSIDTSTSFLGSSVTVPILIAPTGGSANAHPDGELNATKAASSVGIPQVVSSSVSSMLFVHAVPNAFSVQHCFQRTSYRAGYTANKRLPASFFVVAIVRDDRQGGKRKED